MTDNMTDITLKKEKIQDLRAKYHKYIDLLDKLTENTVSVEEVKHWINDLVTTVLPESDQNCSKSSAIVVNGFVSDGNDCDFEADNNPQQTKTSAFKDNYHTLSLNDSLFGCDISVQTNSSNNSVANQSVVTSLDNTEDNSVIPKNSEIIVSESQLITDSEDIGNGCLQVSEDKNKTETDSFDRFDSIGSEISSDDESVDNKSDKSMSGADRRRLRPKCDKQDSDSSEIDFEDSSDSPESDSDSDYQTKGRKRQTKDHRLVSDKRLEKYQPSVDLIRISDIHIEKAGHDVKSVEQTLIDLHKELFNRFSSEDVIFRKMKTIKQKEAKTKAEVKDGSDSDDSIDFKRLCRIPKVSRNLKNGSKKEETDPTDSDSNQLNSDFNKKQTKKIKTSTPKSLKNNKESDLESDCDETDPFVATQISSIGSKVPSKVDALDSDISDDEEEVKQETKTRPKRNIQKKEKHSDSDEEIGTDEDTKPKGKNSGKGKNGVKSEDKTVTISDSDEDIAIKRKVTKRPASDDDDYKEDKDSDNQSSDNSSVIDDSEGMDPSANDSDSDSGSDSKSKKNKKKSKKDKKKDKKNKRKRVRVHNSSDEDDCKVLSDENDSPNKSRKNIRKILSDKKIKKQTKDAAESERDRVKRIKEKQKEYNDLIKIRSLKSADVKELILEFDKETKEPIVEVDKTLVKFLKPHQKNGIEFMYNCIVETIDQLETSEGSGCILAHSMGLGKTLQVITFLYTILTHKDIKKSIKRALVICPVNTIKNWANEFRVWLVDNDLDDLLVFEMFDAKTPGQRAELLTCWHKRGGVMIIGLTLFSSLVMGGRGKKPQKFVRDAIQKCLLDPGPEVVICDEGHLLKNEKTAYNKAVSQIKSVRRVVLTGTPLQNNLIEYHVMVSFVKPNLLGTKKEFTNRFVNPITNGQHEDSTDYDVKIMKKRVHILHTLLNGCVHRCDYNVLVPYLQPKYEYVISVMLTEKQIELYSYYLKNLTDKQRMSLLADYGSLRLVWNHPILLYEQHRRRIEKANEDSMDEFVDDDEDVDTPASCDSDVECIDDNKAGPSMPLPKRRMRTRYGKSEENDKEEEEDKKSEASVDDYSDAWFASMLKRDESNQIELSGKFILLFAILEECEKLGDKILLFSQSLDTLDLVEEMLKIRMERAAQEASQNIITEIDVESGATNDATHVWIKNKDYFRLDGSTASDYRKAWIDVFNDENNYRARLFLISTKAGGLGINLVGANRCIIFDASWNPTHDVQAIFRIFRFGQKKPVYVYRFVAQGTMEEKIYERQIIKQSLSCRVVDEQAIQRHFKAGEMSELYIFKPDTNKDRPTPKLPKDRLLADLLLKHKDYVVRYHEHDSLLENKPDEDMTEDEKQAAWNEYEQEKDQLFLREQQEREQRVQREYFLAQAQANQQQQQQQQQQQYQQYQQYAAQIFQQLNAQNSQFQPNVNDYQSLLQSTIYQSLMKQQEAARRQQQQRYQEARAQRMAELAAMSSQSSTSQTNVGSLPGYDRMTVEDIAKYLKHLNPTLEPSAMFPRIFSIIDTGLSTCTKELNLAKTALNATNTAELRSNYEKLAKEVYNLNIQKQRAQQLIKNSFMSRNNSGPNILRTHLNTNSTMTIDDDEEEDEIIEEPEEGTSTATKPSDQLIEEVD